MKKINIIFLLFLLTGILTSCLKDIFCVSGNGIIKIENRTPGMFDQLENSTSFDVIYRKADTAGISIRAEQNLFDYIKTSVNDNYLEIRTSPGTICFDYSERPVITVTSPSLKKVINTGSGALIADEMTGEAVTAKMSGSGDISVDRITCNSLSVILSGSGNIDFKETLCTNSDCFLTGSGNISITGDCDIAHLKITGSGNIYSGNFITQSASVIISGSGNAFTNIENYLNGIITGSGNIYVKGDPEIDQTISGSGRIIKHK